MNIILIKLFVAHLLGDFLFQPNSWVAEKESRKLKSPKLYLHVAIHAVLMFVLTIGSGWYLQILLITLFHLIIDALKLSLQRENTRRAWFIGDQAAHIASILLVWYFTLKPALSFDLYNNQRFWLVALGVIAITWPASILIKIAVSKWAPQLNNSLSNAGKYIGIIERLLVFVFAFSNHWEAIGFLLAAKSVFRFGDLKDSHDLKLTEYVLIGTLLSFGIAILAAMAVKAMMMI
ncbi:MAG: hypothetical protein K0S09_2545 [Sphingobacteriaceae bacterium]|jgi:hypothetical protein|nr:hypothetical protein [Sphingobacteriaceae bacterium]